MDKKYSIGFLLTVLIVFIVMGIAYDVNYKNVKEHAEVQEEQLTEDDTVITDGQILSEECYFLMEVNGYVVVYMSDRETVYEYTNIQVSELPYLLQNEIKNGKYMENQEALYGFLENYSS